jgi:DNA-binding FadR family transcriptional regulator
MTISPTCSISSSQSSTLQTNFQQRRQAFQQLSQALQSGDLKQAQQAYSTLTQYMPASGPANNSQVSQDFQAIGKALQSGNLADAQTALAAFQKNAKAAQQGSTAVNSHHHHHHHHHSVSGSQNPTSGSSDSATAPVSQPSPVDLMA